MNRPPRTRAFPIILLAFWGPMLLAGEIELARSAPLRKEPSVTSERLDALKAGDKPILRAAEQTNRYYSVSFAGKEGWVHSSHVVKPGPAAGTPTTMRIGSFNVLHLGWGQSKDLKLLASLIADYDLCVLIEVMENPPEEDLLGQLDAVTKERAGQEAGWKMLKSELVGRTSYKERYAFVYRSDRVQVRQPGQFIDDGDDTYDRDPYFAAFRSGNFDFTLIAIHVTFGKKTADRKKEINSLRQVFEQVQASNGPEQDVILVGDFNLPADHEYWRTLTTVGPMTGTSSDTQIINLISPATRTSISAKGYASSYDNIWIDSAHTAREFSGNANANQFVQAFFPDDEAPFQRAREVVSDHVPVWAEFKIDQPDDD